MEHSARIFVAGHRGLVGSAIRRALESRGHTGLVLRTHAQTDLTDRQATEALFAETRPEYVFLAAAKVGGILANDTYPADFIRDNLSIQNNVIDSAHRHGVRRLLFLGSSCIYPKFAPQPIKEEHLLTGLLEPTNRAYALAKIAGIETCWSYNRQHGTRFLAAMPTNLYGPNDNFDPANSHVIPALVRKFCEAVRAGADQVPVWGSGRPRREFLHSDDLADASLHLMNLPDDRFDALLGPRQPQADAWMPPVVNIGSGSDLTIAELAERVARASGFGGRIVYDSSKPDGTPRKLMDSSRLRSFGWSPRIGLDDGLAQMVEAYRALDGSRRA